MRTPALAYWYHGSGQRHRCDEQQRDYSLFNSAGGRFAIDAVTGVVSVANGSLLDREAAATHQITVRASSSDGSYADSQFTINISDVNEFAIGAISDANATINSVNENAASGSLYGLTADAQVVDARTT